MRLALEALRDIDVRSLLPKTKAQTLILHRRNDLAIPVQAGRYLAEQIPRCQYFELDGKDHWWWVGDAMSIIEQGGTLYTKPGWLLISL